MSVRQGVGLAIAVAALGLMCGFCVWEGFLGFVWVEDRGADREAMLWIQPVTCLCMAPTGMLALLGAVLAAFPRPSPDATL